MNKNKSQTMRFIGVAIATFLVLGPLIWAANFNLVKSQAEAFGQTLSERLAQSTQRAAIRGDLLSVRAILEQFTNTSEITGATISDIDGITLAKSGTVSNRVYSTSVTVGNDQLGFATIYLTPTPWWSSLIVIAYFAFAIILICLAAIKILLPKAINRDEEQSGILVTLELGDLPGLADQLSTHTINNLYRGLQRDIRTLFEQLGGELYLAQGPVLRGLFTGSGAVNRAAQAALILKRLTHQWAEEQGVGINRRIAVQNATGLNLAGDLINNHQRAQVNRRTAWLLKSGQPGDIIFDAGLNVSVPNGLTYREHSQLQIISQLSQPLERSVDLNLSALKTV